MATPSTTPTSSAVPSTSITDLVFNSELLDILINGSDSSADSRVGDALITWQGIVDMVSDLVSVNPDIYDDTTDGLASTSDGDYFSTPGDDGTFLILYRNDNGSATFVASYPTLSYASGVIDRVDAAEVESQSGTLRNFPRTQKTGDKTLMTSLGGLNMHLATFRNIPRGQDALDGLSIIAGSSVIPLSGDTGTASDAAAEVSPYFSRYAPLDTSVYYARDEAGESQVFAVDADGETQVTSAGSEWQFCSTTPSGLPRVLNTSGTPVPYSITANGQEIPEGAVVLHKLITGQSLALGSRGFVLSDTGSHEIETGVYGDIFTQSLPAEIGTRCLTLEGGPRPSSPAGSTQFYAMYERAGPNPLLGESISSGWAVAIDAWAQSNTGMNAKFLASISAFGAQPYDNLKQGTATYNNALSQVQNANNIAAAGGQAHIVPSISIVHGESQPDTSSAEYSAILQEWRDDYNTDILAITGQSAPLVAFVSQTNTGDNGATYNVIPEIPNGQMLAHEASDNIIVTGPKYQYPYYDAYHMLAEGYVKAGEVEAKAESFHHMGKKWQPLKASSVSFSGSVVTVQTNIDIGGNAHTAGPIGLLAIDESTISNPGDYGFQVEGKTISSVSISDDQTAIKITLSEPAVSGDVIRYAMQPTGYSQPSNGRRGNIRDGDERTTSRFDGKPVYNWLVAFETTLA